MGKHPDLDKLDYLFERGTDFRITDRLYEDKTGQSLPKDKNYLKNHSALARKAKEKGYIITELQEKPIIERTVVFKKR